MPSYRYERLSPQDAAFLAAEGPNTPMHVGAIFVAESDGLRTKQGGIDFRRVCNYVDSRLHLIPRYRQRIAYTPIGRNAIWVDDEHFDIDFHVRHTALPRPGNLEQLKRLAGRILAQQLDRGRPLWELWVAEGLEGGERLAIISKVHHCMIDGVAGAELMTILMSATPEAERVSPVRFIPRPPPQPLELVRDDTLHLVQGPFQTARRVRALLGEGADARRELSGALRGALEFIGEGARSASETPINRPVGPHRRFDCLSTDLVEVKAVKDKLGGTINDVVLATVAGAVRRFLERRRVNPGRIDFRAAAPVSVRGREERATGNRVSAWIVRLPVAEPDPVRRLESIRETTRRLKESKRALGADLLSAATEWTGTTLLSLGTRFQNLARPHNMVVTNVPGPQIPLYLLGAKLCACYPILPLFRNHALGVALFSYDGRLFWGLNADRNLVPDLDEFRREIELSYGQLRNAAGPPPSTAQS